ncbi:MAG: putative Ig domain-containing protein [Bryobacteraceae bacterium]
MKRLALLALFAFCITGFARAQGLGPTISCTPTTGPTQVGVFYSATCTASGGIAPYTWSISAGALPAGLTLSSTSGSSITISGTPTTPGAYSYTVQVTDTLSQTAEQSYSGTIAAVTSTLTIGCSPNTGPTQVGVAYSATCTAAGGTAPYTWSISSGSLPDGLTPSMSGSTLTISGTPTTPQSYAYTVQVTDSSTPTEGAQQTYSGNIGPASSPTVTISCSPITGPTQVGVAYAATCTASGGTAPYSWSISSGALPDGITLTSSGSTATISGTPQPDAAGAYSYTVQVTDATLTTAQQLYSGTINPAVAINCVPTTGPTQVGIGYSATCTASGGTAPYTWSISSGALPDGITLSSTTGSSITISGTPKADAAGAYSYTVQVSDSAMPAPQSAQQAYSGTINPAVSISCVPTTGPTQVGVFYSATCTASGGTAPYTWSISPGSLPPNLTLSSTTGSSITISGVPTTAGAYAYTVQVTDSAAQSAQQAYSGNISAGVGISCVPATGPTEVGVAYSATCTASGGTAPYSWSISSGALPPNLALSSTTGSSITISGTPTTAAGYSYTVQVIDSASQTAQQTYSGTINPLPTVACTTTTGPTEVGVAYSVTCRVSNGTSPYTWSISSGSLPAGIKLSSTTGSSITISGAPTSSGPYSYAVQVADSASQTAQQSYSGTINPLPSISCTPTTGPTQVGVGYSATCTASGGTSPYTWSISAGSLPAGIKMSSTTGSSITISGTPTTAGPYSYTVQVADQASKTASQPYSGNIGVVAPGLTISCSPTTGPTQVGIAYSATCTASGGTAPYSWSISSGSLPAGVKLSSTAGSSITIGGTPTTSGAYSYTVQVTDSSTPTQRAHQSYSGTVSPPSVAISIVVPTSTSAPTQQVSVGVQLATAYPTALQGILQLSFTPSVAGLPSGYVDPGLQFLSGGTTLTFTIPQGQAPNTPLTVGMLQQGTVAGTITIELTKLTSGSTDVTPQPHVTGAIAVPALAPVITASSVQITNVTATGFDVQLTGYSTTREVTTASFSFSAAAGTELVGSTTFSVPVTSEFSQWFGTSASQAIGSMFELTVPFTLSGSASVIQSVSVTLTNSVGTSAAVSGTQ